MRHDLGYTGLPDDMTGMPLIRKVKSLVAQDKAMAQADYESGFTSRQVAQGVRQSVKFIRPPEVNVGSLMDVGS